MANVEQVKLLTKGATAWNNWRVDNLGVHIDLSNANLNGANLSGAFLMQADLRNAHLYGANLRKAKLMEADLSGASLVDISLDGANLHWAILSFANLTAAHLKQANLSETLLTGSNLSNAMLSGSDFSRAVMGDTIFQNSDLSEVIGLEDVRHRSPSIISTNVFALSKGKIPPVFLRRCGLSDVDIEYSKLSNPDLSNEEIDKILYKIHDLRATQSLQISPLFISYSHGDMEFVDKIGASLTQQGIRYWRDIHEMKSGRIETQIDRAINQNRTVLLVLSENSLKSDWVEHEVRTARDLEKEMRRDVLCPVAVDDSWKDSRWPKRVMEQIMEYNILDFSAWKDDVKFEGMFRKLIDGLELFYKG